MTLNHGHLTGFKEKSALPLIKITQLKKDLGSPISFYKQTPIIMNTIYISRQQFLQKGVLGGLILPFTVNGQTQQPEKPAPLKVDMVKEFVGVSHGNFARAKEMLENEPLLLHSSYDWGGGDFESGIEAAGHVGNNEIAAFLLSKGARYNIYLACMLGHLDVVKLVMTSNSSLLNSKGPHGFTMLHHANKGGEQSKMVVEYLQSLGAKETKLDFYAKA